MKGKFFACGIQNPWLWNPSSTDKDWNSVSEIRNPRRGMKNPRLSWIPHIPLRGATPRKFERSLDHINSAKF